MSVNLAIYYNLCLTFKRNVGIKHNIFIVVNKKNLLYNLIMNKKDYYMVEKNVDKIINQKHTNFLDPNMVKKVSSKLKGKQYNIYYPYKEAEKVIIYTKEIPKIKLIEILSYNKLTHSAIMGSLYSLNISSEMFGDIIIYDNHYYIIILESTYDLIKQEFNMVGNNHIKIKEVSIDELKNYKKRYDSIEIIVSSLRIDTVISRLIGVNREDLKKKFNNEEIILNYEPCSKTNYNLKEGDIFSIRKYGKYKYIKTVKNTKKDNFIIKIDKYTDN